MDGRVDDVRQQFGWRESSQLQVIQFHGSYSLERFRPGDSGRDS
jgi:hypothetical protein